MFSECNGTQLSFSYVFIFMPKNFCIVNSLLLVAIKILINVSPSRSVKLKLADANFLTKHDESLPVKVFIIQKSFFHRHPKSKKIN